MTDATGIIHEDDLAARHPWIGASRLRAAALGGMVPYLAGAQPPGDLAVAIYGASESDFAKVTDATLARVRLGRMWHSIVS